MRRLLLLATALAAPPALAAPLPLVLSPYGQCDAAIDAAVKGQSGAPDTLLPSIARVESGRLDPATGRVRPWPWTINVDGTGFFFENKDEVVATVQSLQARGTRSIDVGCMQVNLMHHPDAFADLDEAFDPVANARYAMRFLTALHAQTRDWSLAAAWYHSTTPDRGEEYQRLVFGRVVTPMGGSNGAAITAAAVATLGPVASQRYGAIPPASASYRAFTPAPLAAASFGGVPLMQFGFTPSANLGKPAAPKK